MDVEIIAKCLPAQPDEGVKAFVRKNWHELGGFVTIFKRVAGRDVPSLYGEPQTGYFAECWCSECGETWHTAWGGDKKQYTHTIPKKVLDFCDRWEREVLAPWWAKKQKQEVSA